jgi:uncharacterized protein YggU (UPF0235/DUF167 family)
MKAFIPLLILSIFLAGCTTSSQVQEMIDAAHRDYLEKSKSHDASIDVLRKSAIASLEKSKANGEVISALEKQMDATLAEVEIFQGNSDAAKVMSAANTVKVAELEEAVTENKESIDRTLEKMAQLDRLYEETMIRYFQLMSESAAAAMKRLTEGGLTATNGHSSGLAEPIEIVAPDTTSSTNL